MSWADDFQDSVDTLDPVRNAKTLDRIVALFVRDAPRLGEEHIAVFDEVLGFLAARIETHARAALGEALADVPNAPPRLIERLAQDDIAVARPVLARSDRLTDDMLVKIALALGQDHMLAIAGRARLSEMVTTVLVENGDLDVVRAAADNRGAQFSSEGFNRLIDLASGDARLQAIIGDRPDLPHERLRQLVGVASAAVRQTLMVRLGATAAADVERAVSLGARTVGLETRRALFQRALRELPDCEAARRFSDGVLSDADLQRYARESRRLDAAAALTLLADMPAAFCFKLFTAGHDDVLFPICRIIGLRWRTVEALYELQAKSQRRVTDLRKIQQAYEVLSVASAERIVAFLRMRDAVRPAHSAEVEAR